MSVHYNLRIRFLGQVCLESMPFLMSYLPNFREFSPEVTSEYSLAYPSQPPPGPFSSNPSQTGQGAYLESHYTPARPRTVSEQNYPPNDQDQQESYGHSQYYGGQYSGDQYSGNQHPEGQAPQSYYRRH